MIKIFLSKIADKKLKSLGFEKTVDTKYFVRYERGSTCFGITRGEAIAAAMKISSKRW